MGMVMKDKMKDFCSAKIVRCNPVANALQILKIVIHNVIFVSKKWSVAKTLQVRCKGLHKSKNRYNILCVAVQRGCNVLRCVAVGVYIDIPLQRITLAMKQ
jgi:hypothetical protein